MHAIGHFLNPKHFFNNPEIANDDSLLDGLYECIRRLGTSTENVDDIYADLDKYRAGSGNFKLEEAIRHREDKRTSPGKWLLFC